MVPRQPRSQRPDEQPPATDPTPAGRDRPITLDARHGPAGGSGELAPRAGRRGAGVRGGEVAAAALKNGRIVATVYAYAGPWRLFSGWAVDS